MILPSGPESRKSSQAKRIISVQCSGGGDGVRWLGDGKTSLQGTAEIDRKERSAFVQWLLQFGCAIMELPWLAGMMCVCCCGGKRWGGAFHIFSSTQASAARSLCFSNHRIMPGSTVETSSPPVSRTCVFKCECTPKQSQCAIGKADIWEFHLPSVR